MSKFERTCPYCGSEDTDITDEVHDEFETRYHIMMYLICRDCGKKFVGEDQYELFKSATAKDSDELWDKLNG